MAVKLLLHCIFRAAAAEGQAPAGRSGADSIVLVEADGLAAALAPWEARPATASGYAGIERLLRFERLTADFYEARTVIPFRFGCAVESAAQARLLLREQGRRFGRLLERLEGMAEISVLVFHAPAVGVGSPVSASAPHSSGAAYLAAVRRRYNIPPAVEERWVEEVRRSLAGCYAEQKSETRHAREGRLTSIHFLAPRGSIETFRERLRVLRALEDRKHLISGPWPPYHFVEL